MERLPSGLQFSARYPFSRAAKELLIGKSIDIDYSAMERAKKRVTSAIAHSDIPTLETDDAKLLERELISYPISKMIISLADRRFMNRYIDAEVRRAIRHLRENEEETFALARDLGLENNKFSVDVRSYLKFLPKARESRLLVHELRNGVVSLNQSTFMLLLSEMIRRAVSAGLPIKVESIPPTLKRDVEDAAKALNEEFKEIRRGEIKLVASGELAPCMAAIMEKLKAGEHVGHTARWAFATYMLKRNYDVDALVNLFSNTPNFNEKTTRYQIDYVRKKGYGVPNCANIDSYGLCIAQCGIKSPLFYGLRRRRYGRK